MFDAQVASDNSSPSPGKKNQSQRLQQTPFDMANHSQNAVKNLLKIQTNLNQTDQQSQERMMLGDENRDPSTALLKLTNQ